jgi:hypothetical protein
VTADKLCNDSVDTDVGGDYNYLGKLLVEAVTGCTMAHIAQYVHSKAHDL